MGMVEVIVVSNGRTQRCPVTPETGAYSCGYVSDAEVVGVKVGSKEYEAEWDGKSEGGTVTIQR